MPETTVSHRFADLRIRAFSNEKRTRLRALLQSPFARLPASAPAWAQLSAPLVGTAG